MLLKFIEKIRNLDKENEQQLDQNNKGFTLVELLVAIVILTMVMMPISRLFITAGGINKKARKEQMANISAGSVLESARAFPLFEFDKQCRKNTYADFKIVANMDSSSYSSTVFTQYDSTNTTDLATSFKAYNPTYAYRINGLKQNNTVFDAIVIFEKENYRSVNIGGGTITESQVSTKLPNYNVAYSIRVYVYDRGADVSGETFSPDNKGNALVMLTGSKLDNTQIPS